ncbi:chromosomal replication initiator protein DnaA [bacterium]|nr:chromosomal replication initiator protein DnaA [bacterium]
MEPEKLWKSVLGELELAVSPTYYNTFFPSTKITKIENESIEIFCQNNVSKEILQQRYSKDIKKLIKDRTGQEFDIIFTTKNSVDQGKFITDAPLFGNKNTSTVREQDLEQSRHTSTNTPLKETVSNGLVKEYNFQNFIVGPNNRLAYTVAKTVAENPGNSYNPFLIYSGVGLGKTHLLHAIGNEIFKNHPDYKIVYCTGQEFLNDLMEALQNTRTNGGTIRDFKKRFTDIDVWLIDDVQVIAGREATQEEFYFAFNHLYLSKKQIVLSSDRHPSEIKKLHERISSRFNMGMVADVQKPDVDVRTAILRNKREDLGIDIDNETLDYIANNINSNIRELEGAFTQVVTYAKAMNIKANISAAKQALNNSIVTKEEKNIKPNKVVREVCEYYHLETREVKGPRRTKEVVLPRQIIMYLLKEINQLPLMEIGVLLGNRDHTTVMYGIGKIKSELKNDNFKIKKDISIIKEIILDK